jgi:hypothetical protein
VDPFAIEELHLERAADRDLFRGPQTDRSACRSLWMLATTTPSVGRCRSPSEAAIDLCPEVDVADAIKAQATISRS